MKMVFNVRSKDNNALLESITVSGDTKEECKSKALKQLAEVLKFDKSYHTLSSYEKVELKGW